MNSLDSSRCDGLQRHLCIAPTQRRLEISPLNVGLEVEKPLLGLADGIIAVVLLRAGLARSAEVTAVNVGLVGGLPALKRVKKEIIERF